MKKLIVLGILAVQVAGTLVLFAPTTTIASPCVACKPQICGPCEEYTGDTCLRCGTCKRIAGCHP